MERSQSDTTGYWESRLERNPGLEGVGFLNLGRNYNCWLYRLKRRAFHRALRRLHLSPGRPRVLDVGSGTGFCLREWQRFGVSDLVGSDLTQVAVARLKEDFARDRIIQLDIGERLSGDIGRFDVVSALDVVFHIVDDDRYRAAFANISRLLDPGGLFIFSENFLHGPTQRSPHQTNRSLEEIGSIVNQFGFDVVERRPMMVLMNAPADSRSAVWTFLWKAITAPARVHEVFGWLVGAILFPIDLLLTVALRESPTTELCVCRKRA